MLENSIRTGIQRIIEILKRDQSKDGAWRYPFETGIASDCYMIILLRTLEIHEENLIHRLAQRIISKQEKSGGWKLYEDEERDNVSATVEAYYALLYSGCYQKNEPKMRAAKQSIIENGGIEKTHLFTKFMLAMTGQIRWPPFFPLPVEFVLLSSSFPLSLEAGALLIGTHFIQILMIQLLPCAQ